MLQCAATHSRQSFRADMPHEQLPRCAAARTAAAAAARRAACCPPAPQPCFCVLQHTGSCTRAMSAPKDWRLYVYAHCSR